MLGQAVGDLLPSAVGVALSPIPIIAIILMLATPRARSNGLAFAAGWVVGLVAVSVVVLLVANDASDPNSTTSDGVNWVKIAIGVLFLALAVKQWRARPRHGETAEMPKWMNTIDSFTAIKSAGLGVVLSALNPKNLALTLAAAASIAQADLSTGDATIAVAVFVVIASITVAGPVLWYVIAPRSAAKPLDAIKQFMADHNAVIMFVLFVVLGAKILGDGLGGITT
jgi:threonine/homoserine/homoserine lactone efflux protein